jgi:hypothetical protein
MSFHAAILQRQPGGAGILPAQTRIASAAPAYIPNFINRIADGSNTDNSALWILLIAAQSRFQFEKTFTACW